MFGMIGTRYIETLPNVDEAYIRGLQTRSGLDLADLFPIVDSAMSAINEGVDPLVAMLCFPTTSAVGKRRRVTRKHVQSGGEFTIARGQLGGSAGHMLGIGKQELAIAWSEDGLHEMSRTAIDEELDDIVRAYQMFYKGATLDRLFSPASRKVDKKTNVTSPGFAGSGTGDNVFNGLYKTGQPLPGGYTHYAITDAAGLMAAIVAGRDALQKFHPGPFDIIPSEEAVESIKALSSVATYGANAYTGAGSLLLRPGQGEREALVNAEDYVGVVAGNVRVMNPVMEIGDTNHFAMVKSYGEWNPDNPLAWRYDPTWGREVFVRTRDPFPLADAVTLQWLGINVYDRVGAFLFYVDETDVAYEPPTVIF